MAATEGGVEASGTFRIGGELEVRRLGFGAMRVTGKGIWGEPANPAEARRTLKRVPELGIDLIDTADSYGPFVSEAMIAEVLAPYPKGLVIATKGGLARHGPNSWLPLGRPEYLKQCVLMSLRRLKLERLDLWQLHRIDPKVPREEQFDAMAQMQKEGLVRHLGLSNVGVEEIEAAGRYFRVATVQNRYNLVDRKSEEVLGYCQEKGIGFIPWYPLAAGDLSAPGGLLAELAQRLSATPSQVALAWVLKKSQVMLPIPGTSKVKHLEENARAASLTLSEEDFQALDAKGAEAWQAEQGQGAR
jgi:aryl-alcohol dehydrogenase-like predicted oxidoreductase